MNRASKNYEHCNASLTEALTKGEWARTRAWIRYFVKTGRPIHPENQLLLADALVVLNNPPPPKPRGRPAPTLKARVVRLLDDMERGRQIDRDTTAALKDRPGEGLATQTEMAKRYGVCESYVERNRTLWRRAKDDMDLSDDDGERCYLQIALENEEEKRLYQAVKKASAQRTAKAQK